MKFFEGLKNGCLFSLPIWAVIILILTQCACGAVSTLPIQPTPVDTVQAAQSVRVLPTLTPFVPVMDTVTTLGTLNVRACPSTQCAVIGWYEEGAEVTVGKIITNDDWNCWKWYPVQWRTQTAYICAEWTGAK